MAGKKRQARITVQHRFTKGKSKHLPPVQLAIAEAINEALKPYPIQLDEVRFPWNGYVGNEKHPIHGEYIYIFKDGEFVDECQTYGKGEPDAGT